jgi:LAS superfamily LD-carboxypeptidase LdcB
MFNSLELTGRCSTHVREIPELGCILHSEAALQALAMRAAARTAGIELAIVSSFRDFDRQLVLWNAKYSGERQLLDRDGRVLPRALERERSHRCHSHLVRAARREPPSLGH